MRKRSTWRKYIGMLTAVAALCAGLRMSAAAKEETAEADRQVRAAYEEYQGRLNGITRRAQIADSGFRVIEDQIFPLETDCYGEIMLVPAMEERYQRLALFFTKEDGTVVYGRISWRPTAGTWARLNSRWRRSEPSLFRI